MTRLILALVLSNALLCGCQSANRWGGGCIVAQPWKPVVRLVGTTATQESPAQAFPNAALPLPVYPDILLKAGIRGMVIVRLDIDKGGLVTNAVVLKSTQREFEEPVLRAVRQWNFNEVIPYGSTLRQGAVVDCEFEFTLRDDDGSA